MASAKQYVFNKVSCCTNPDIVTVIPMVKNRFDTDHALIKLAINPDGKWIYGYEYWCHNGGAGCAPCITRGKQFERKSDAVLSAINLFKNSINNGTKRPDKEGNAYRAFLRRLQEFEIQNSQLSLF